MITKSIDDASLTKENEELAVQSINAAQAVFPWLIGLTPEVRQSLPKMGKGGLDFVERTLIYGKEHPNLVTAFQDLDTQDHKLGLLKQIQRVLSILEPFCEELSDTYMLLGTEAYASARVFYNTAKAAAKMGVPGCDVIVKDLAERYKKQFSSTEKKGKASKAENHSAENL